MAKSYVALSLNEKVKVIEAKEEDKFSVREIMDMGVNYTFKLRYRRFLMESLI
jgi:hypothetical protein